MVQTLHLFYYVLKVKTQDNNKKLEVILIILMQAPHTHAYTHTQLHTPPSLERTV